ncbi:MAG TPA: hypothetical protein VE991_00570 [Acidimicrobiales bacterium]|nr:hypothetical protein [Acidimicrobiales bacterium]
MKLQPPGEALTELIHGRSLTTLQWTTTAEVIQWPTKGGFVARLMRESEGFGDDRSSSRYWFKAS